VRVCKSRSHMFGQICWVRNMMMDVRMTAHLDTAPRCTDVGELGVLHPDYPTLQGRDHPLTARSIFAEYSRRQAYTKRRLWAPPL